LSTIDLIPVLFDEDLAIVVVDLIVVVFVVVVVLFMVVDIGAVN